MDGRKVCLVCQQEFPADLKHCPEDGTPLAGSGAAGLPGSTLAGSYDLESLIGTGGTSMVYRAYHRQMQRPVAIKMLRSSLSSDEYSLKRFQQEARAVSQLTHPNVITVFDVGVSPHGEPYIVMEYLEGISLFSLIKTQGNPSVARCLHLFIQTCNALAHAHQKGVIHRDLKPSNIMLVNVDGDHDFVKILDFGLAKLRSLTGEYQKLTKTGDVFGSPSYMSPEQCTGSKIDARSDIYSFGCVMYEALTGKAPFRGSNSLEVIRKHLKEDPPPFKETRPDLLFPCSLETIVLKALRRNPDERYQTMESLKEDLEIVQAECFASLPGSAEARRGSQSEEKTLVAIPFRTDTGRRRLVLMILALAAAAALSFWFFSSR